MADHDEEALRLQAARGDEEAFGRLVRLHRQTLARYIRCRLAYAP